MLILENKHPFGEECARIPNILNNNPTIKLSAANLIYKQLIEKTVEHNMKQRFNIDEILRHKVFGLLSQMEESDAAIFDQM